MPWNAQHQRAAVLLSTVGNWLHGWSWCPPSVWLLLRDTSSSAPPSSHIEDQACWTRMPVRGRSHDNAMWHFPFICVLPFLLVHGLSSDSLSLSPQSPLSWLQGLPFCFIRRLGGACWGITLFIVFIYISFFLPLCGKLELTLSWRLHEKWSS